MSIHTSGYSFEVENFGGWNNGVSRFYYYQTVNTNEHIYSFSYNGASITPNSNDYTIVYKTNQAAWFDYDDNSIPWSLTTTNGVTSGTNSAGDVLMKWGHTGFPDPTISASGGGTSTEGVSVANGSITIDAFGALYFTVDKSSPLTVGTHDYGFYLDGFLQGTINHSLSTLDATGYQNNPSDGLWQLSYQGGSSVEVLASYTIGRNKKVHANFW
jgi:hypothetical protein